MTHRSLSTPNSGLRVFSASLLSTLLIMMPFVQLAAAEKRLAVPSQRSESGRQVADSRPQDVASNTAATAGSVFVDPSLSAPAPLVAPAIVATKDDGLATATTVAPGGTINYSVNIKNNGTTSPADDATGVTFTDIIDAHTTLVINSAVAAVSDRYNAIGNVLLTIPDGSTDLLGNDIDPDTGSNAGMTATAETKSSTQCTGGCSNNVTINANGSFTYDPPVGFSGTDTFTYTAHSTSGPGTATETVTITVANEIWFINNNAGACPGAPCDGRLSHPFVSLAAFNAANLGGAGQPGDNDWIFVYESAADYTGPATLRNGQKFIGQDATASLATLTTFPAPSGTDLLPAMNSGNGTFVNISGTNVNGINLNSGNTLRGFRVGNVGTGTKISGTNFGTLVVGNNISPDVLLHGTGQALNLTTGTLSNTGGFISVTTTSSGTQGIILSGVADSDGAGAGSFSFGSTTVSGSTSQGILIGTSPADLSFGNTSVTGGTNGVSFQNNSGGTRTFGTLGISGGANEAFLHGAGGGNVTVTGIATLSSTGSAVSVSAPGATNVINFQAATSATTTGAGVAGVNWAGAAGATLTFNSLSITRNNGTALNAIGGGTVNVTNATGSITNTTAGGPAIVAANIALNANFSSINSSAGANGVSLTSVTGTSNFGTGQLTGTVSGATFLVNSGTASVTYSGNITQAAAAPMVSIIDHGTGTVTFQTGALQATLGTGISFDNADGTYNFSSGTGTTTLNGGNAHIDIIDSTGGTITFGANTTITNPSGVAVNVDGTANPITGGISIAGSISKNSGGRLIDFFNYDTGTATISASLSCTSSCDGIEVTNNGTSSGTVNFTAATKTLNTGTDIAVNLDNNDGGNVNFTGGGLDIDTTSGVGFNAINGGTVTVTGSGNTITSTTGTALNGANTSIGGGGLNFVSIAANGAPSGIVLNATGTAAGNGSLSVTGTGAVNSGGIIQNTTGDGISLIDTKAPSFDRIRVATTGGDGISGSLVRGFTLKNSTIFGAGDGDEENGIIFGNDNAGVGTVTTLGVDGTVLIQDVVIDGNNDSTQWGFRVYNKDNAATLNMSLLGLTVQNTDWTNGEDGVSLLIHDGTANVLVDDGPTLQSQFLTTGQSGITAQTGDSTEGEGAVLHLTIQNSTFTDNYGLPAGLNLVTNGDGTARYKVHNNTITGAITDSVVSGPSTQGIDFDAAINSNLDAIVTNNTITMEKGTGLEAIANESAILKFQASNNVINLDLDNTTAATQAGMNFQAREVLAPYVDAELHVTLTSNTINGITSGIFGFQGTNYQSGSSSTAPDDVLVCTNMTGNSVNGTAGLTAHSFRQRTGTVFQIQGLSPASGATEGQVESHIQTNNSGGNLGGLTDVASAGGTTIVSYTAATCATPTTPTLPPVAMLNIPLAPRAYEVAQNVHPSVAPSSTGFDVASGRSFLSAYAASALTHAAAEVHLSDAVSPSTAASSSETSAHHAVSSKRETRSATHDEETGLRAHYAALSKLATRSATTPTAAMAGETVTANIGTLPAGGSVTITFQVTVNNPPGLTLLNPPRVENQGTVSGNFTSVLTDDPNVGGAADKTATRIDLFDTTTSLVSDINPSNDGDTVTFTATVNETPVQGGADPTGTVDFIDTSNGNLVICNDVVLTAGSAQCAVSNLSAGSTHNIRADYSGDGNFDPSQSNIVAQVVNACVINPVVTNTSDSGAGSLRDALATVCSAPSNNITFNIPIADPGFSGGVYTITALTELTVTKNVNITGPNSVTNTNPIVISGNNATRVFKINSGKTVTMTGFTVTGGSVVGSGGGILNDHGTLTLTNMTISGNAASSGGGVYVDGTALGSASLTVNNSTISGNTSTASGAGIHVAGSGGAATLIITNSTLSGNNANVHGGGLYANFTTTSTLTNVTVTNNRADNDNNAAGAGGGLGIVAGAITTLHNTIVAGNFRGTGSTRDDINGALDAASSYNLIGDGTDMTGISNADANQNKVGSGASPIDPVIGPLANNGGPTFTHRILANSSPAMDAGNTALTTDQRGQPRPKDNLSVPNATGGDGDDIGAYEAPLPPNAPDLDAASDTGSSSTDDYTSDNTPTFTIQGVETGAFVELLAGATVVASGTVGSLCSGFPCIQLTSSVLADGPHSMTARQTVAGGLSPTSTGLNVTIDTGVPGAPTIDLVAASDSGASSTDDITNAATRTFDIGNTETGATVELLRDGNPITSTTGNGGTVQLSDSTAAVSGTTYAYTARQTDGGGNQATSGTVNVTFDNVGPTVSMSSLAPNPTNTSPIPVSVLFNESVNGFTAADIVPGNATVNNFAGSGANYTFDLVPSGQGTVTADIGGAVAQDTAGNDNTAATQFSRTFDNNAPTADITDVAPDPRNSSVSSITIVFTEAVTGFDMADLTLTLDGGPNLLTGAQTLSSGDGGITWTLGNLSGLTGAGGTYLLTLTAAGSGITDNAGNALAGNATDSWVMDTTAPTVTINQAAGQADPTSSSPINFTVVFSEPVTGFTNADVTFSGAGATTATVTEVAPNDGTTYNVAISGMNANGAVQADVNVNAAQDAVGNNSAASTSTDNQVTFINAITINVNDAKIPEPASPNTIDMTFTVSLSAPAPAGGVTVNFTTNDGSATFGTCGTPGADYVSTSGQVAFTVGQQVKTINVPVCSDAVAEGDETLTVTLSSPTAPGVIGDGTATGTITAANPAGAVLISELRTSGPAGAGDDFVEIYNNSNAPLTVAASDISAGYGLYKMGADCNATPVLIGVIPNGTVIPARGHYLFVGSAYSLGNYGGTGAAAGNLTLATDIETDANVGLFSTSELTAISSVNRLDAVGFGVNVGGACNLLREGSTLPAITGNETLEHSFFRKMCDWILGQGCTVPGIPKDTNTNAEDFWLADTTGSAFTGRLGAPGPENLASPIRRDNANNPGSGGIDVFLLDSTVGSSAAPNRKRDGADPAGTFGSMTLRYRVINNTGGNVTRLRYRVVDVSTAIQPVGPNADLRALTSSIESVGSVNDSVTCTAGGAGSPPCTVTVQATTLEAPPNQPIGGGYNSTLSSGTITLGNPLTTSGTTQSILINFKLGVEKTGAFRFYVIVEALP